MIHVKSDITGNVWQVKVEPGQLVAEGDVLIVLESMKMEIPVEAPSAGVVAEVKVAAETRVQEGDVVVVIDTADNENV